MPEMYTDLYESFINEGYHPMIAKKLAEDEIKAEFNEEYYKEQV